jgi:hypothetical protein
MSTQGSNFAIPNNIERILATLSKAYGAEERYDLQELIVNSKVRVDQAVDYIDNLDFVAYGHVIYLTVPDHLFAFSVKRTIAIQDKIKGDLRSMLSYQNEFISKVSLEVDVGDGDWRKASGLLVSGERIVPPSAEERIWGGKDDFRIFLSHISQFKVETSELRNRLKLFGISCFVAHKDIQPTKEWQDEIELALASMDGFVALLTDKFHESSWTDQEVGFAFARRVPIVAVKLGKDPYGFIGKFQALTGSDWNTCDIEIVKLFIKNDRMLTAYIRAVCECPNWDAGNILAKVLPFIEKLTDNQIDQIVTAFNDNSELRGSFGFNGTKPSAYGNGVIPHLNRLGTRQFRRSGIYIEIVS